jgi:dTMP kinase
LLWGPAKDASVPNLVRSDQLSTANSLGLVAAYGTFPLGGIVFATLAGVARWLGGFAALDRLAVHQVSLALWVDSLTFVVSALLIMRLALPEREGFDKRRVDWTQTYRDMKDGILFIRSEPLVRGTMIGLAGGLLGGGVIVPLGPVFARAVLGAGPAGFGLLMVALGIGAAIGVPTLLRLQRHLPHESTFVAAVMATGAGIIAVACVAKFAVAALLVGLVGAAAASAYVIGFTVLQESVSDELRGRVFATLYTIVRLCLLLSLTIGPFAASLLDGLSRITINRRLHVGSYGIALPGVRLALIAGGAITIASAFAARRRMRRAHQAEALGGATP